MNIEQLINIKEIENEKSISSAAIKLHLTHAAVSKSLSNFEKEIGFKIFNRYHGGCTITENGKILMPFINQSIDSLSEIKTISENLLNTTYISNLTLGAIPSLFLNIFPNILLLLNKKYPLANIEIEEGGSREIVNQIIDEKIDLGFIIINEDVENISKKYNLKYKVFDESKMVVFTNKQNNIAKKNSVSIKDLGTYPMIFYKGINWNKYKKMMKENLENFNLLFTTNNSEVIKEFVSNNNAISILSEYMINSYCQHNNAVTYTYLNDYQPEKVKFAYVYKSINKVAKEILPLLETAILKND